MKKETNSGRPQAEAPRVFTCAKDRVEVGGSWPGTTLRNSLRHAIESCEMYGGKCTKKCPIKIQRNRLIS
jgi:hypothetical protein